MKSVRAIALAAGLSCVSATGAKPPLQLAERGVRVEPLAIAPARIENGKFVFGAWQEYQPVQTRGAKGYYYIFDCFGGWVDPGLGSRGYVNLARGGLGAEPGEPRTPWSESCGLGSARWFFGLTYTCPLTVDDIESLAPAAPGGSPIDAIDAAWYWGGGECVLAFFPSDDSADCETGDPIDHSYYDGLVVSVGELDPGGYYYVSADGIWSQQGVFFRTPRPGGSYLAGLLNSDGTLNTVKGSQFMLWGTGDAAYEPYRPGGNLWSGWNDDWPIDGAFSENECYDFSFDCPNTLGKMVGFLSLRCPADLNWDGEVTITDYELFMEWYFAASWLDRRADVNADGFINGNDYDTFASWFDEGC